MNQEDEKEKVEDAESRDALTRAGVAHAAPFIAWLFLMQMLGDPAGWKYAVRSVVSLGLLLWLKPWRGYAAFRWRDLSLAVLAGLAVFAVWVLPETGLAGRFPFLQDAYLRWGVMPFGELPAAPDGAPYAPSVCGWPLTIVRILGSAFVIAVAEEFFWRGFIYRWMIARDFRKVDLGVLHVGMLLGVSLVFGVEHNRWLAGTVAGLVYAGVMIRTRNIWAACAAHIVTNLVLGVYVVATGSWAFW